VFSVRGRTTFWRIRIYTVESVSVFFHQSSVQMVTISSVTYFTLYSIPYEITEFFNLPNPSCRTMALGSTQPDRNEYQ
jgi:hypothetical protein